MSTRSALVALMGAPDGERLRDASFLSLPRRYLYVDTPKAACTTLKQLVACVEGLSAHDFRASLAVDSKIEMLIHDHTVFNVPSLVDVAPAIADEALNSSEFFRFCFVRNPYSRMFSAWQSKILLREPYFLVNSDHSWLERYSKASTWEDIRQSFTRFVRHIYEAEHPNFSNPHWLPQSRLILHGKIDYTHLGRVESFGRDIEPFFAHLQRQGVEKRPELSRSNPGLLRDWRWFYDADTSNLLREMYREDFENFGYTDIRDGFGQPGKSLPDDAADIRPGNWIEEITARNEMIVFLRNRLVGSMARETAVRQELDELKRRGAMQTVQHPAMVDPAAKLPSQARSLWARVARRITNPSLWHEAAGPKQKSSEG